MKIRKFLNEGWKSERKNPDCDRGKISAGSFPLNFIALNFTIK